MTTSQTTSDSGPLVAPFAARVVLPIAGLVGLVHCAAAAFGEGYWFDEVYMLAIGHYHLDWGSADQPPLAPALAAVMDAIAPGSLVALRLPAALATAAAVVVAGLIARELGCDCRARGLTAAAQATGAWAAVASLTYSRTARRYICAKCSKPFSCRCRRGRATLCPADPTPIGDTNSWPMLRRCRCSTKAIPRRLGDRRRRGDNLVEHPMAVDATCRDVADRWRLRSAANTWV